MKDLRVILIRRLLLAIPILFGVTVLVFFFVATAPQSAAVARLNSVNPEAVAQLEQQLGLNDPLHEQYLRWLGGILTGDFGRSLVNGQKVLPLLIQRLSVSAELALFGFLWMIVISTTLGLVSAFNHNRLPDHFARVYAVLGISIPDFVVGLLLIVVFGVWLNWLPAGGWAPLSDSVAENLRHVILPSYTVGAVFTAIVTRMFRSDLLDTKDQPHVTTAKAMGIGTTEIIRNDIVRPAIIPTITTIGMTVSLLLAGLVLAETVFAIPGLGRLAVRSIFNGNFPVIQGTLLIISTIFVVVNIVVDLTYYYLDPRIRMEES